MPVDLGSIGIGVVATAALHWFAGRTAVKVEREKVKGRRNDERDRAAAALKIEIIATADYGGRMAKLYVEGQLSEGLVRMTRKHLAAVVERLKSKRELLVHLPLDVAVTINRWMDFLPDHVGHLEEAGGYLMDPTKKRVQSAERAMESFRRITSAAWRALSPDERPPEP